MSDLMKTFPVVRVTEHHPALKSFYFETPFRASPGQFVNVWLPGMDEKPFSVSDVDCGLMEITVRAVGPFTRAMMNTRVRDYLGLRGPFGNGFQVMDNALLVGGGIGIAPIRFLANTMKRAGHSMTVLLGGRAGTEVVFQDDFSALDAAIFTEDGSIGTAGLVTDGLDRAGAGARARAGAGAGAGSGFSTLCACGPEGMLLAVRKWAEQRGLHYQLAFERYMKCGIGICGQCSLDGSGIRLCTEGPVLNSEQLAGVTELGKPQRDASGRRPGTF